MNKSKMADFFTRDLANEGIRIPLFDPYGEKTEHWLQVRGIDSDEFRRADIAARRQAIKLAMIEDEAERAEEMAKQQRALIASLVADWSFKDEKPCTVENVAEFFLQAPQIMDAVDQLAAKRANFFAKRSSS